MSTVKESDLWKANQPRRDYLASMKDSIDNYLKAQIQKLDSSYSIFSLDCWDTYEIVYSTKGKLKDVRLSFLKRNKREYGWSYVGTDKIEQWRCKRKIRKLFKKINLSAFDLKYGFQRIIEHDSIKGWIISGNYAYE